MLEGPAGRRSGFPRGLSRGSSPRWPSSAAIAAPGRRSRACRGSSARFRRRLGLPRGVGWRPLQRARRSTSTKLGCRRSN